MASSESPEPPLDQPLVSIQESSPLTGMYYNVHASHYLLKMIIAVGIYFYYWIQFFINLLISQFKLQWNPSYKRPLKNRQNKCLKDKLKLN